MELEELSAHAPEGCRYTLMDIGSVADERLSANAAVSRAWRVFRSVSPETDVTAFSEAAKALWRVENAYTGLLA